MNSKVKLWRWPTAVGVLGWLVLMYVGHASTLPEGVSRLSADEVVYIRGGQISTTSMSTTPITTTSGTGTRPKCPDTYDKTTVDCGSKDCGTGAVDCPFQYTLTANPKGTFRAKNWQKGAIVECYICGGGVKGCSKVTADAYLTCVQTTTATGTGSLPSTTGP